MPAAHAVRCTHQVEIIANDQGNRITPSYVAYDGSPLSLRRVPELNGLSVAACHRLFLQLINTRCSFLIYL
jgi:molecular chaperone DnaK (HSP70)